MKKIITAIMIVLFSTSCVEDVIDINDGFIKVLGQETLTEVRGVVELSNGDYMVLGKFGKRSFIDISNNIPANELQRLSAGLMITDQRGNVKVIRSYPIESVTTDSSITLEQLTGKVSLLDAIELENGGYLILGQLRDMDITIDFGNEKVLHIISDESNPAQTPIAPILMKLNQSLDVESVRMLTGTPGWNNTLHIQPKMKKMPDGNIALVFGQNVVFNPDDFGGPSMLRQYAGYRLTILDSEGKELIARDYNRSEGVKHTRDFTVDNNNNIHVIGERNGQFAIFTLPAYSWMDDDYWDLEEFAPFANGGNGGFPNTNDAYLFVSPSDKLTAIYTNPPQEFYLNVLNNGPSSEAVPIAPSTNQEYPRAACMAENGDILIYSELLNESLVGTRGFLTRMSGEGNRIFRFPVDGLPRDVIETNSGNILLLSERPHNGSFTKGVLIKYSADGKIN